MKKFVIEKTVHFDRVSYNLYTIYKRRTLGGVTEWVKIGEPFTSKRKASKELAAINFQLRFGAYV